MHLAGFSACCCPDCLIEGYRRADPKNSAAVPPRGRPQHEKETVRDMLTYAILTCATHRSMRGWPPEWGQLGRYGGMCQQGGMATTGRSAQKHRRAGWPPETPTNSRIEQHDTRTQGTAAQLFQHGGPPLAQWGMVGGVNHRAVWRGTSRYIRAPRCEFAVCGTRLNMYARTCRIGRQYTVWHFAVVPCKKAWRGANLRLSPRRHTPPPRTQSSGGRRGTYVHHGVNSQCTGHVSLCTRVHAGSDESTMYGILQKKPADPELMAEAEATPPPTE